MLIPDMLSSSPFLVVGTHVQAMIFPPWSCETLSNICLFCDLISLFFSFLQGNYVFIFISKMHVYDAIMMLNKENSTVIFKATSSSQHKDLQRGSHGWSTISLVMGTNFWVLAGKYALAYFLEQDDTHFWTLQNEWIPHAQLWGKSGKRQILMNLPTKLCHWVQWGSALAKGNVSNML